MELSDLGAAAGGSISAFAVIYLLVRALLAKRRNGNGGSKDYLLIQTIIELNKNLSTQTELLKEILSEQKHGNENILRVERLVSNKIN